jgi:hypothetical protein
LGFILEFQNESSPDTSYNSAVLVFIWLAEISISCFLLLLPIWDDIPQFSYSSNVLGYTYNNVTVCFLVVAYPHHILHRLQNVGQNTAKCISMHHGGFRPWDISDKVTDTHLLTIIHVCYY